MVTNVVNIELNQHLRLLWKIIHVKIEKRAIHVALSGAQNQMRGNITSEKCPRQRKLI